METLAHLQVPGIEMHRQGRGRAMGFRDRRAGIRNQVHQRVARRDRPSRDLDPPRLDRFRRFPEVGVAALRLTGVGNEGAVAAVGVKVLRPPAFRDDMASAGRIPGIQAESGENPLSFRAGEGDLQGLADLETSGIEQGRQRANGKVDLAARRAGIDGEPHQGIAASRLDVMRENASVRRPRSRRGRSLRRSIPGARGEGVVGPALGARLATVRAGDGKLDEGFRVAGVPMERGEHAVAGKEPKRYAGTVERFEGVADVAGTAACLAHQRAQGDALVGLERDGPHPGRLPVGCPGRGRRGHVAGVDRNLPDHVFLDCRDRPAKDEMGHDGANEERRDRDDGGMGREGQSPSHDVPCAR